MKIPTLLTAAAALATAVLSATPEARAQDFGSMLGRLAERATERAARNAIDEATRRPSSSSATSGGSRAGGALPAGPDTPIPAPDGVEPWPINAGMRSVQIPSDFEFSDEMMAQQQAYREASRYACSACEASIDIDSWQKALRPASDTYSAWGDLISTWTVGRVIPWRGGALDGRITVVSDKPVGNFQCRQLRHRISTRERTPRVTETPGLICLGKRDQYSSAETWHSVF